MQTSLMRWTTEGRWQEARPLAEAPTLVLWFGQTEVCAAGAAYAALRERFPAATIAGCSAGSAILGAQVLDGGTVAVAIHFARTRVRAVCHPIEQAARSFDGGAALARTLQAPDLVATILLSDGLAVNGSALIDGVQSVLGASVPTFGGLAGDGDRFASTVVGLDETPVAGRIVMIGLYGEALRLGQSAVGGWDAFGPPRRITAAEGNVLFELDGEPALDLYERYLGDEARGLPSTALLYPLRIWDDAHPDQPRVRTVLAVDREARSMTFAGDVPAGWSAQLMRGMHDRLVAGAGLAAQEASDDIGGTPAESRLALLVSCVGRRLLMEQRTDEELEAVQEAIGATPAIGFYSYGEIARRAGLPAGALHNQTMTVAILEEAA